ncbi:uncharacterized protein ACA1_358640 [Acanthamoeba castellanii str. Neff]|uniref:Uncharacterized protein n=1 Tax=Acanthamoeba castellanii (strain ATCC 30010 / Neff) TaxID=1257118 RepID=L8GMW3_ACACF|nr:uncharacterized protein ACA1_358640 [Acanthamoeba castellanii str. Neff]ELR13566.1 hypothetical protein ACA1_358640 [Acanthamoeba castellanii str. Neff]
MADQAAAFGWGVLSAVSFPLGCAIGLFWPTMPIKLRAVAMGFGGGALLFALTLSLFGEVLFHIDKYGHGPMLVMLFCALAGGMIFLALDFLIEERGGWVRRLSKNRKRLLEWRKKRLRPMLDKLRRKNGGYAHFSTVESYQLEIEQELEEEISRLDEKELHLQTTWNPATEESKADFDTLAAPLVEEGEVDAAIASSGPPPDSLEPVGSGVGLAIWLGMLIDGITTVSADGVSYALVIAFFLANLPEALSSSIIMLENGMSKLVISCMWLFLVAMTGVGAIIGSFMKEPEDAGPNDAFYYGTSAIEGLAAGAMLVVISNAMFLAALFLELSDKW